MRRWCRDRAGVGAIIAFVIWVISIVLIYALSQSQAQGDALTGVLRAAGLRSLQWAGRSALTEVEYKLRHADESAPDPLEAIRTGGTPPPVEPVATLEMYREEVRRGELAIGSVELARVTPVRANDSKEPWYVDLTVKVVYRMGRTRLERKVRRRLVAYCQPMIVSLGPGAGSDPTKGVFDATLVLEPRALLEVMEQ